MLGQVLQSQTPSWELSLLQRGHQDRHIPSPHAPRSPGSPGTNAARCERPICIGGIRGSPRKRMAQALIKSTSNNKPPQQCAGSERAVRWQEPRGSSRRARAKRELCPRRGCKGAGGEGLAGAGAAGTFPESWQGPEGLLGDEMVASCFGRRFQEFGCCGGVSWAGSSATGQGFCLKKKKRGSSLWGQKVSKKHRRRAWV